MTKNNLKNGYTIIETMIAISIFLIVTIVGMGALLSANAVHNKSQDMREVVDNLSFILEDMSRNLRTGRTYHCMDGGFTPITTPQSCGLGYGIAFEYQNGDPLDSNDQWIYKIESPDGIQPLSIYKSTDSGATFVKLNPDEVTINSVSGFSVFGAEPPPGDIEQPFVTIKLTGDITFKNVVTPFSLQTSVSQRTIDI